MNEQDQTVTMTDQTNRPLRTNNSRVAPPIQAFRDVLHYLGEDPFRDGLQETPARVLKALKEMTAGSNQEPMSFLETVFENDGGYDGPVIVSGIGFTSLCEHHLLPFTGKATLAYQGGKMVGLSKLPRMFLGYAQRLQVQERLTTQAAEAMFVALESDGSACVITASHSCMGCRGVKVEGNMTTSQIFGDVIDMNLVYDQHRAATT